MRRWNGWGDDQTDYPLTDEARAFLNERVGPGSPPKDASREQALAQVPDSRWDSAGLSGFDTGAEARLAHARGQSFPDWVALRSGQLGPFPDAVAFPECHDDAVTALDAALKTGAVVVPYGGGTSVVGHLNVPVDDRPVVSVSLERMNRLLDLDPVNALARFGAGTPGPQVEAQLLAQGWMLGHFPQSYEYSTVGGWVVTRSSGQQSMRYGRIENLFSSGRMITPRGELSVGGVPASAAGQDLRECVMGSEGRMGLLTEAVMRVRRAPAQEHFHAVFFPDWASGFDAVREITQAGAPLSMLRLSNPVETDTQLRLAGKAKQIAWLKRYLGLRGVGEGMTMLMVGVTGSPRSCARMRGDALALCSRFGGVHTGRMIGKGWSKNRFHGPYLRNELWEAGYAADTVETSVNWTEATGLMEAVEKAARDSLQSFDERVHAFTHLSHVYRQGCSVYSTFVFRAAASPEENMARWRQLKGATSEAIVAHGGTISHQHGVGVDHAPYLKHEKGDLGMDLMRAIAREFDPNGQMNPGKLIE